MLKNLGTRRSREALLGILLTLPAFTIIVVIVLRPLIANVWQSFFRVNILGGGDNIFVGLENILFVLKNPYVLDSLKTSLYLTVATTVFTVLISFGLALLLDRPFPGRGIVRTMMIIPWAVPVIVAAFAWSFLADPTHGLFNYVLLSLNLVDEPVNWLAFKNTALLIVIAANVWKGLPFMLLVTIAALKQIPRDLYDIAKVEGASWLGTIRYVIIPGIRDVIAIGILLRTIWFFNYFDLIFLLTGGGPGRGTEVLPIIAYRTAFQEIKFGRASAVSNIMLTVSLILVFLYFRYRTQREQAEV